MMSSKLKQRASDDEELCGVDMKGVVALTEFR